MPPRTSSLRLSQPPLPPPPPLPLPLQPPPAATETACVALLDAGAVSVLAPAPHVAAAVSDALSAAWPKGVKAESPGGGVHLLTLANSPWTQETFDVGDRCALALAIVGALAPLGWRLLAGIGSSRQLSSVDSLYFERLVGPLTPAPAPAPMFGLCLHGADSLRLVGEARTGHGDAVRAALQAAVAAAWPHGFNFAGVWLGCHTVRLNGAVWSAKTHGQASIRFLLAHVVRSLAAAGFGVVAALRLRQSSIHGDEEPDALLFELRSDATDQISPAAPTADLLLISEPAAPAAAPAVEQPQPKPLPQAETVPPVVVVSAVGADVLEIISPPAVGARLATVVRSNWPPGIRRSDPVQLVFRGPQMSADAVSGAVATIRLNESPWSAANVHAAGGRLLMLAIIASLLRDGWRLAAAPDGITRGWTLRPFLFEPCPPVQAFNLCAVSLVRNRWMRLMHNASDMAPEAQDAAFAAVSAAILASPCKTESVSRTDGVAVWALSCFIWDPFGEMELWNRGLVVKVIDHMRRAGFALLDAARFANAGEQCDTLVFLSQRSANAAVVPAG